MLVTIQSRLPRIEFLVKKETTWALLKDRGSTTAYTERVTMIGPTVASRKSAFLEGVLTVLGRF